MAPTLRNGVTPAGSRLVCPRSERRFSVIIRVRRVGQFPLWRALLLSLVLRHFSFWMGLEHLSEASLRALLLRVCFQVVLADDESLRLSLALSSVLPCPMLWLHVRLHDTCSRSMARWGWGLCRRLLFAPCSRSRLLSWWSSLWLCVFGNYWISPLFFPDRRYDSRAPCTALLPVHRLSFVHGIFSFWLGFDLCLKILWAPCGCQCAYGGPLFSRKSARVLASMLGSSPSRVRHLSRVCSSVCGPVGVAHSFHPSLLLGGVLVRLCGGPC